MRHHETASGYRVLGSILLDLPKEMLAAIAMVPMLAIAVGSVMMVVAWSWFALAVRAILTVPVIPRFVYRAATKGWGAAAEQDPGVAYVLTFLGAALAIALVVVLPIVFLPKPVLVAIAIAGVGIICYLYGRSRA